MRRELPQVDRAATEPVIPAEPQRRFLAGDVWQDLRYAARVLAASPGFTGMAVLTLALGIGATTAIVSIVDATLLRPLAFDPESRLVRISVTRQLRARDGSWSMASGMVPSIPTFEEWRSRNRVFDAIALQALDSMTLLDASPPERVAVYEVTSEFFRLFDAIPVAGRMLTDADVSEPVAVISYGCWQRRFGGAADVVGTTVRTLEGSRTIVGVLPAGFGYLGSVDFFIPLAQTRLRRSMDGWASAEAIGLLKPGTDVRAAQAHMDAIAQHLRAEGLMHERAGVAIKTVHEFTVGSTRTMLYVLTAAVSFILLIACVNVAGLLTARGAGRIREMAIRSSLGASRIRLARQLLTESLVLAVLGGTAGALLAWWTLGALVPMLPVSVPDEVQPSIDLRILAFATFVSGATGLLFGLLPALRLSRAGFTSTLKEGNPAAVQSGRSTGRLLVTVEVALALVLLVGAGLMVRSLQRLLSIDPGFDTEQVLMVEVSPLATGGAAVPLARQFYDEVLTRISALPAVESASATDRVPFWSTSYSSAVIEGRAGQRKVEISPRYVLPGYFRTMGIAMSAGRDFTAADRENAPCVVVVNQKFARQHWPEDSAVGRRLLHDSARNEKGAGWCDIAGIVADVRHRSLERDVLPEVYFSALQAPVSDLTVMVRTSSPASLVQAARAQLTSLPAPALVERVIPFDSLVAASTLQRERRATLLSLLGALGVLLACVGIYGLTTYAVARRTQEIGIRMALGANAAQVLRTVLGSFAPAIAAGIVIGLFSAWAATGLLAHWLFGIAPTDPLTLAAVSALLTTVALLACYLPARRALRVDPVIALRAE